MTVEEQLRIIKRGVEEIISEEELKIKLKKKKSLIVKYGADPSRPDLHLGHTISLRRLKVLQDLGHKIVFIIGDFTAMIGDPSGVSQTRPQLSRKEVDLNAKTYAKQVFNILDAQKTKVVYNSSWLKKMTLEDVIKLSSLHTVARMLERDDFNLRFREEKTIGIHEFLYPLIQGYDSVAISSDLELGGTDQKFNFLLARSLQKEYNQEPQVVITFPMLEGIDGKQKMSKSLGNYIGISEPPEEMYGKIMSIPDTLIIRYFELLSNLAPQEVLSLKVDWQEGKVHPRDLKKRLAKELVSMYHSKKAAALAEDEFENVFQKGELPKDIPVFSIGKDKLKEGRVWICRLLVLANLANSHSEARRLIIQGGVEINKVRISDIDKEVSLDKEIVLKVGKRRFAKVLPNNKIKN